MIRRALIITVWILSIIILLALRLYVGEFKGLEEHIKLPLLAVLDICLSLGVGFPVLIGVVVYLHSIGALHESTSESSWDYIHGGWPW